LDVFVVIFTFLIRRRSVESSDTMRAELGLLVVSFAMVTATPPTVYVLAMFTVQIDAAQFVAGRTTSFPLIDM